MGRFRYQRLAAELEGRIFDGQYRVGTRLPSLRNLHFQTGLSITTIAQAYGELESHGLVESREKSGYFVRAHGERLLPLPQTGELSMERPRMVTINSLAESITTLIQDPGTVSFGAAIPACELLPTRQLASSFRSVQHHYFKQAGLGYGEPEGEEVLKRQIAARSLQFGRQVATGEMIVTNGCMDAIQLCLRAVTQPGDIVITESPTFTCYLQLMEQLGLMALEIPTDARQGNDLNMLEEALFNGTWRRNRVGACLLNPTFQNPLGFDMPLARKKELVEMLAAHQIPLIEDDIYGELHFDPTRPVPLKFFDAHEMVLYCSSFSKTLAPDFRIGWILPGRFHQQIARLKFNSTIAQSKLPQLVVANYLEHGDYERHLRRLRKALHLQVGQAAQAIARSFPQGTKLTAPRGGFILWVELDPCIDGLALYRAAREQNLFVIPGIISSSTGRFNNCIRLSCGSPWNGALEEGIVRLGTLVHKMGGG